jgi:aminoglycoside N3'-acetyltransferase
MAQDTNERRLTVAGRARRFVRRSLQRVFFGITRKTLVRAFRRLGLQRGDTVCVHSSLRSMGYIVGGPAEVLEALFEAVGPEGCVMMPSFPLRTSMAEWVQQGMVYDVRETPATTGALTELFRRRPDVLRSLHPTNPVAAWGATAADLLRDHEKSPTPYGMDTPYGRLVERDRSFVLMMSTHVQSLLHHLQERVDFPNLFLPDEATIALVDHDGQRREIRSKVMRPRIPYFIAIPPAQGSDPDWAILHDFGLMFPRGREVEARELGYDFAGYPTLWKRREVCERQGILTATRVGRGEMGLLRVRPFISLVEPELRGLLERFRTSYDVDAIEARKLRYG